MPLKNVEKVRERVALGCAKLIGDVRYFLSCTDNGEMIEPLRGKDSEVLLARLTDTLMAHLGQDPPETAVTPNSPTRRIARKLLAGA